MIQLLHDINRLIKDSGKNNPVYYSSFLYIKLSYDSLVGPISKHSIGLIWFWTNSSTAAITAKKALSILEMPLMYENCHFDEM